MKNRDLYLQKLLDFKDKSLVKVITGVRRCGKSFLLDLFEQHLLSEGVTQDSIIRINFESLDFDEIKTYRQLHEHVKKRIEPNGMTYILLDEVQMIENWERAVNSLRLIKTADIYITGSNAHLLSSEISTLLSGRYIEIKMLPLSFKEFVDFNDLKTADTEIAFDHYLEFGGFPGVSELMDKTVTISPYLNGIYNTIIMRDVVQRNAVRDPALLDNIIRFLSGNIGNMVSAKKISDYLTSSGRKTTSETVENYIKMLENAFIFYHIGRYDIKGKQRLKTQGKYYVVDIGIRNELSGERGQDYGSVLDNIVYLELLRRGYSISIGRFNNLEIDFVASKPDERLYVQVTATMLDETTRARELKPLSQIPDNYRKIILSMDKTAFRDYEGITNEYLLDFLLN